MTETTGDEVFPFHRAVYYTTVLVIGRPVVAAESAASVAFMTCLALVVVVVIPTFVAEMIRLWYENKRLDSFPGDPEKPHVIVAGDAAAARMGAVVQQVQYAPLAMLCLDAADSSSSAVAHRCSCARRT